jgi:hypothetical protein
MGGFRVIAKGIFEKYSIEVQYAHEEATPAHMLQLLEAYSTHKCALALT